MEGIRKYGTKEEGEETEGWEGIEQENMRRRGKDGKE